MTCSLLSAFLLYGFEPVYRWLQVALHMRVISRRLAFGGLGSLGHRGQALIK